MNMDEMAFVVLHFAAFVAGVFGSVMAVILIEDAIKMWRRK